MGAAAKDDNQREEEEGPQDNNDNDKNNERKIHVSRIPTSFTEDSVKRILEDKLGNDTVQEITLIYKRPDDEEEEDTDNKKKKQDPDATTLEHRGFGFVTLASTQAYQQAVDLQSIRGGRKATSSRKHTLYIRPYTEQEATKNICFLWSQHRCPYGDECKFRHEGTGGLLVKGEASKKKQKCFAFKKGKCKRGDACPFSHDFDTSTTTGQSTHAKKLDSAKDCINWKTKGKCRKGDACPYRHDESVRQAALEKKKKRKQTTTNDTTSSNNKKQRKEKQPLWVRVFGLNYETREHDVREFLQECGPIMQVDFPRFEDSGRSKGYCGVLFQSPKAVAQAVELDGQELMGRWLRIQAGKMLLDQWEGERGRGAVGGGEEEEE